MQNRLDVSPSGAVSPGSEELVQGTKPLQPTLVNRKTRKIGPTAVTQGRLRANLPLLVVPSHAKQPQTKSAAHNNVVGGQVGDRTKK